MKNDFPYGFPDLRYHAEFASHRKEPRFSPGQTVVLDMDYERDGINFCGYSGIIEEVMSEMFGWAYRIRFRVADGARELPPVLVIVWEHNLRLT